MLINYTTRSGTQCDELRSLKLCQQKFRNSKCNKIKPTTCFQSSSAHQIWWPEAPPIDPSTIRFEDEGLWYQHQLHYSSRADWKTLIPPSGFEGLAIECFDTWKLSHEDFLGAAGSDGGQVRWPGDFYGWCWPHRSLTSSFSWNILHSKWLKWRSAFWNLRAAGKGWIAHSWSEIAPSGGDKVTWYVHSSCSRKHLVCYH